MKKPSIHQVFQVPKPCRSPISQKMLAMGDVSEEPLTDTATKKHHMNHGHMRNQRFLHGM